MKEKKDSNIIYENIRLNAAKLHGVENILVPILYYVFKYIF